MIPHTRHLLLLIAIGIAAALSVSAQSWRLLVPVQAYTVQINQQDPNKLYVGNWANQMYRSEDGGKSWEIREMGSLSVTNYITSLISSKADTNVMLAGGFSFTGIKRSTDGGETWTQALVDGNLRRMWFVSEAIIEDPQTPTTLYAARGSTYNGVYRSTNTGATWDSISVIDPNITGRLCTIAIRPDSTNILFIGAEGGVMMRSDDSGLNWYQVPVLDTGYFIKEDSEIPKIVFSPRDPMTGYAVVAISTPGFIEGNGGILKTTDGGASWSRIAYADTSFWAVDVRTTPNGQEDDVFLGGFRISNASTDVKGDSLIFRSQDGGETWSEIMDITWQPNELEDTIRNVWVLRWDPQNKKMYMATQLGLYVWDEGVSVDEDASIASTGLSVNVSSSVLTVFDDAPISTDRTWAIYGMNGVQRESGAIMTPAAQQIDIGGLPSGRYLLTWGSEQRLRTALFTVVR